MAITRPPPFSLPPTQSPWQNATLRARRSPSPSARPVTPPARCPESELDWRRRSGARRPVAVPSPRAPSSRPRAPGAGQRRHLEQQLQQALRQAEVTDKECRDLRALLAAQLDMSERLAADTRRDQRRLRERIEGLAADNDQLRVLLARPRSAAHRDEVIDGQAAEISRLREALDARGGDDQTAAAAIIRARALVA